MCSFVMLGYVLCYRLLNLIRARQEVPLLDALVSSTFRAFI